MNTLYCSKPKIREAQAGLREAIDLLLRWCVKESHADAAAEEVERIVAWARELERQTIKAQAIAEARAEAERN